MCDRTKIEMFSDAVSARMSVDNIDGNFHIPFSLILSIFFFNLSSDAQLNYVKNNFKIYIKIDIKTAPTCFGVITIIRERTIRSC